MTDLSHIPTEFSMGVLSSKVANLGVVSDMYTPMSCVRKSLSVAKYSLSEVKLTILLVNIS